jgi:hypothetical protein
MTAQLYNSVLYSENSVLYNTEHRILAFLNVLTSYLQTINQV